MSALILAAYYRDDVAVVKLLCGKGANVNSKDEVILLSRTLNSSVYYKLLYYYLLF